MRHLPTFLHPKDHPVLEKRMEGLLQEHFQTLVESSKRIGTEPIDGNARAMLRREVGSVARRCFPPLVAATNHGTDKDFESSKATSHQWNEPCEGNHGGWQNSQQGRRRMVNLASLWFVRNIMNEILSMLQSSVTVSFF